MSDDVQKENVADDVAGVSQEASTAPFVRRERSTIEFPYVNLEDAEEAVKDLFREAGVTEVTTHQVGNVLGVSVASSGFRTKLSALKLFGLVEGDTQHVSLTMLGRELAETETAPGARVQAFRRVPLYRAVTDKHEGHTLPPPAALQRELIQLGVATKMAERARQVLERSARHAGFMKAGGDRFVTPIVQDRQGSAEAATSSQNSEGQFRGGGPAGLDPVIKALVDKIPPAGAQWPLEEQIQLLQMLAMAFHMTYKNKRPIIVSGGSLAAGILESIQRAEGGTT